MSAREAICRYLPISGWLPESSPRADILAGIALAGLLVPEGMAYAGIAGLPPQMGLYAARPWRGCLFTRFSARLVNSRLRPRLHRRRCSLRSWLRWRGELPVLRENKTPGCPIQRVLVVENVISFLPHCCSLLFLCSSLCSLLFLHSGFNTKNLLLDRSTNCLR